jgi:hypothetical protein
MNEIVTPAAASTPASRRLPERLLPALKRWVVRGTVAEDESSWLSRQTGGRV